MTVKKLTAIISILLLVTTICVMPVYADMQDEARTISVNQAITDNLPSSSTVKYYKVELSSPGKVFLSFNHRNTEYSGEFWKITIFNNNDTEILKYNSEGTDTTGQTNEVNLNNGTYYIRIAPYYHSNTDYNLTVASDSATLLNEYPQQQIKVYLNVNEIVFDQPPIIENGRTLVPLRAIFEAMGANVDWDGATRTVSATKGNITIVMQIGSNTYTINGKESSLDVPPQIVNDRR